MSVESTKQTTAGPEPDLAARQTARAEQWVQALTAGLYPGRVLEERLEQLQKRAADQPESLMMALRDQLTSRVHPQVLTLVPTALTTELTTMQQVRFLLGLLAQPPMLNLAEQASRFPDDLTTVLAEILPHRLPAALMVLPSTTLAGLSSRALASLPPEAREQIGDALARETARRQADAADAERQKRIQQPLPAGTAVARNKHGLTVSAYRWAPASPGGVNMMWCVGQFAAHFEFADLSQAQEGRFVYHPDDMGYEQSDGVGSDFQKFYFDDRTGWWINDEHIEWLT